MGGFWAFFDSVVAWCAATSAFSTLYASSLRAPLFTGFFTLSSFLLATNTFLVINMKRELYESDSYKNLLAKQRTINPSLSQYGPLLRLSTLLYAAIVCSLVTSTLQLTLGLVPANLAAAVCLSFAFVTLTIVAVALFYVRRNIKRWLEQSEEDAKKCPSAAA